MTHLNACVDTTSTRIAASNSSATNATAPASEAAGDAATRASDQVPAERYAPTSFFLEDRERATAERSLGPGRLSVRFQRDPQFLLAVALALPVLAVEGASQLALPWLAVAVPIAFVGLQALLTAWRSAPPWLPSVRLVISLAFVGVANAWLDPTGTWPVLRARDPGGGARRVAGWCRRDPDRHRRAWR